MAVMVVDPSQELPGMEGEGREVIEALGAYAAKLSQIVGKRVLIEWGVRLVEGEVFGARREVMREYPDAIGWWGLN